jgi:hypothetical protein
MTITQTVEIPASRRVSLNLPLELPVGRATITVTPEVAPYKANSEKIRLTKSMINEMLQDETVRSLTGILHTDMTLEEIREERLAKYLK